MNKPKYFVRSEFACKCGCGFDTVDCELMMILEDVRAHFNSPVTIHSGCRCPEYNKKVDGKAKSQHMLGRAADIDVKDHTPSEVYEYLTSKYPKKFGIGLYPTFVHVDSRSVGIWRQS